MILSKKLLPVYRRWTQVWTEPGLHHILLQPGFYRIVSRGGGGAGGSTGGNHSSGGRGGSGGAGGYSKINDSLNIGYDDGVFGVAEAHIATVYVGTGGAVAPGGSVYYNGAEGGAGSAQGGAGGRGGGAGIPSFVYFYSDIGFRGYPQTWWTFSGADGGAGGGGGGGGGTAGQQRYQCGGAGGGGGGTRIYAHYDGTNLTFRNSIAPTPGANYRDLGQGYNSTPTHLGEPDGKGGNGGQGGASGHAIYSGGTGGYGYGSGGGSGAGSYANWDWSVGGGGGGGASGGPGAKGGFHGSGGTANATDGNDASVTPDSVAEQNAQYGIIGENGRGGEPGTSGNPGFVIIERIA